MINWFQLDIYPLCGKIKTSSKCFTSFIKEKEILLASEELAKSSTSADHIFTLRKQWSIVTVAEENHQPCNI